ncbi:MAG: heavy metal-binding domain-containing protein, partial [Myxococcales bacterium]|nr:heavy metal-binding domain-containing protein [Myxococcales bacterium]
YLMMVSHAEQMGAHAIVAMRYDATEFVQGATEVLCYGTAVRLERA